MADKNVSKVDMDVHFTDQLSRTLDCKCKSIVLAYLACIITQFV